MTCGICCSNLRCGCVHVCVSMNRLSSSSSKAQFTECSNIVLAWMQTFSSLNPSCSMRRCDFQRSKFGVWSGPYLSLTIRTHTTKCSHTTKRSHTTKCSHTRKCSHTTKCPHTRNVVCSLSHKVPVRCRVFLSKTLCSGPSKLPVTWGEMCQVLLCLR